MRARLAAFVFDQSLAAQPEHEVRDGLARRPDQFGQFFMGQANGAGARRIVAQVIQGAREAAVIPLESERFDLTMRRAEVRGQGLQDGLGKYRIAAGHAPEVLDPNGGDARVFQSDGRVVLALGMAAERLFTEEIAAMAERQDFLMAIGGCAQDFDAPLNDRVEMRGGSSIPKILPPRR